MNMKKTFPNFLVQIMNKKKLEIVCFFDSLSSDDSSQIIQQNGPLLTLSAPSRFSAKKVFMNFYSDFSFYAREIHLESVFFLAN